MKAMVVSIKGNRAAVLAHDGTFSEIKNRDYRIGQILDFELPDITVANFISRHSAKIAAAAAAALFVTCSITANAYGYSTVTLDVNPSLRYELNVFDRVVELDSYNNDGEEIVTAIRGDVMGKKIDSALDITFDALEDADYIEEDTPVVVTVSSHRGKKERLKEKTIDEVNDWNEKKHFNDNRSLSANAVVITDHELKEADEKGESPGRQLLDKIKEPVEENEGDPTVLQIPGTDPVPEDIGSPEPGGSELPEPSQEMNRGTPDSGNIPQDGEAATPEKREAGDTGMKDPDLPGAMKQDSGDRPPQDESFEMPALPDGGGMDQQMAPPSIPQDPNENNPQPGGTDHPQPTDQPPAPPEGGNEAGPPPGQGDPPG